MDRGVAVVLTAIAGGLVAMQAPINSKLGKAAGTFAAGGLILALLRPIEVAHNVAAAPGARPPPSRPALSSLAMPLRSRAIRAAAERHAKTLSPEAARSELAAIRFPGA